MLKNSCRGQGVNVQRDTGINTSTYSKEANRVLLSCKKTAGTGQVCISIIFFLQV